MTNGRRDYKKENRLYNSKPSEIRKRVLRNKARRLMMRAGKVRKGDGKDVDHRIPLSKGGSGSRSNLRVRDDNANRRFRRNKDSSIKTYYRGVSR